jgi:polyamine oxidase
VTQARYDDGSPHVPSAASTPVDRVIVVGAGIAGLTVASALANAGVDCVLLEARDRIGGRLHTIDLEGMPVDLGGSWIHHPVGNPLNKFAAEEQVECRPGNPLPTIGAYDAVDARHLTPAEVGESLATQFEDFPDALVSLRTQLPEGATAAQAIEAYVAASAQTPAQARLTRQALRAVVEADASDKAERQSLRWLWNEIEYGGDLFGDLPVDGYRSVVRAMATDLDIRCGVVVDAVEVTDLGVRVRTSAGAVDDASHVVVTVPLGVLKSGTLSFSPALPPERLEAIEQLGFGHYEKVALRFERPFWTDAGLSHLMFFPRASDQPAVWWFDLDAFGAGPTLVAHVFHSATDHVLGSSPSTAARWARSMIGEAIAAPCPEPVAVAVTSWATDPYTRGAYTHVPPGAHPGQLDLLGEPLHGRVLFAGEHTQSARIGYADGAMTSGIREAKRLLGVPSVLLGNSAQR